MRKTLLAAAVTFAALLGAPVPAAAETVGADLTRPANNTRTCETGFYDPALIAGTGFPYQPHSSCTWWSGGGFDGTGNAVVPHGGGTVERIRVKVGPTTGRMQVVALRHLRHPGSLADPGCCFPGAASPIFTPQPNGITEIAVNMPVKHETDPRTGIVNYDALALSVLDAGVPMPAEVGGTGWDGIIGGMFPAFAPGSERTVGYGTVTPGRVLLEADLAPAEKTVDGDEDEEAQTVAPPPPPNPTAAARLTSAKATIRGRSVRVPVTCAAATACRGELLITAAPRGAKAKARSHAKAAILARTTLTIAAGKTRALKAKLSKRGRRATRSRRAVTAVATVKLGGRVVASRSVKLRR